MDTASSQPGDLVLPLSAAPGRAESIPSTVSAWPLPSSLLDELYSSAEATLCDLTAADFASVLLGVGTRLNFGQSPAARPDPAQQTAFFRSLRLSELALAQACALGREAAWQRFVALYRSPLTQAAIAITGSATLGHELADSLYAELYGLRQRDGQRLSPLTSYSGRGSLAGWLRTTLAQRHIDHHRRTHRETPLDTLDLPAPPVSLPNAAIAHLTEALTRTLQSLPAEDRFLLSAYFLDRRTLLQIARLLHVHEATVSRRLKRLTSDLRSLLLKNLRSGGFSARAAEEALGADPRDLEINLRSLLQTTQTASFLNTKHQPDTKDQTKTYEPATPSK